MTVSIDSTAIGPGRAWAAALAGDRDPKPHVTRRGLRARRRPTSAEDDAARWSGACLAWKPRRVRRHRRRHQRQVYQFCYRFAGNHEDASDLAQDVFIRAYRGSAQFQGAVGVQHLAAIGLAVNVCLNRVGSRGAAVRRRSMPIRLDVRANARTRELLRGERAGGGARRNRAACPKKQRATLILRVYQELPHDQIAAIVGSSVGAVKANFFHALANLKKLLQSQ